MKYMRHRRKKRNIYFIIIFFLLVSISLGYSYLNTTLNLKGSTAISKNTWNVHFENVQVKAGSVNPTKAPTISGNTKVTFSATLAEQGDFYEFDIDIVNAGTIDAMADKCQVTELTTEQKNYLEFSVQYKNGQSLSAVTNYFLPAGTKDTITVRVKFREGLTYDQLPASDQSLKFTVTIPYVQDNGSSAFRTKKLLETMSQSAKTDSSIDFSKVSSSTNGQGVYQQNGSNIYYYRGNVTNNNVLFANLCWKIVRSTDTGGIKLIYNGVASNLKYSGNRTISGTCNNTGNNSQIATTSKFNANNNAIADVGYMYQTRYPYKTKDMSSSTNWVYGNNVTYSNGKYTLSTTYKSTAGWATNHTDIGKKYHYTCFSTNTSCEKINYIYYSADSSTAYYIELTSGNKIENVLTQTNATKSSIKTAIDSWFASNMASYKAMLEDTIWCNDRSMGNYGQNGWTVNGDASNFIYYAVRTRNNAASPSLTCKNKTDSFTTSNNTSGNGKLTYPVGLLTLDEAVMAGAKIGSTSATNAENKNYYLYTGVNYWTMSPGYYSNTIARNYLITTTGSADNIAVTSTAGVRPMITLIPNINVRVDGTGTANNPYIVIN